MSRSHSRATAQNFPDFAQNLEILMRKQFFKNSFQPLLLFFLHESHILCDFCCDFCIVSCAKFQNLIFDSAKKSTFRTSVFDHIKY